MLTNFNDVHRRVMHGTTSLGKSFLCRDVVKSDSSIGFCISSEQNPGFFKALANRCNPIGESTIWNLQNCTRFKVVESIAVGLKCVGAICCVNFATRKHIHSAGKCRAMSALQHKHFETVSHIADQHHSGCRSQRTLVFSWRLMVSA